MESSSSSDTDYTTVWSAPPKKPSGRTKFKETRHPVYRGVRRRGTTNRWICEVRNPNNKSRIWLGTFPTAEMAARAHDVAVMALRGRSACLNFADSASLISIPSSFSSVKELKQAAIEAAKALHSRNSSDLAENVSSSASSTEIVSNSNPVANDQMDSNWDGDGDMNLGLYYTSLAEGLMLEPPFDWIGDLDDNQWCTPVSLWN
ncbi:dehydration-responsive element-binding protein 1C-like protein [Carex littledalei]|uniref:Dehydration-responsive element-binding protein 1C-like protein n=1 Tax=Carex littledalei TaxID=544730 RepID=A0A833QND2_9POAL|nr:dehydration-responsive element-binding protein 1C-like protein [Carex littledalei]